MLGVTSDPDNHTFHYDYNIDGASSKETHAESDCGLRTTAAVIDCFFVVVAGSNPSILGSKELTSSMVVMVIMRFPLTNDQGIPRIPRSYET